MGELNITLEDDKTHINVIYFHTTHNDPDVENKPEDESLTATESLMTGTEMLDTIIKAEGDCRLPSLPPEGESLAVEGGARLQVKQSPSICTCMDLTNPCFACNPTLIYVKTDVSLKKEELNKATNLLIIIIMTWGDPGGAVN